MVRAANINVDAFMYWSPIPHCSRLSNRTIHSLNAVCNESIGQFDRRRKEVHDLRGDTPRRLNYASIELQPENSTPPTAGHGTPRARIDSMKYHALDVSEDRYGVMDGGTSRLFGLSKGVDGEASQIRVDWRSPERRRSKSCAGGVVPADGLL